MPTGPDRPPPGVILAGGIGRRMGGLDKALLPLLGRSLLAHAVARIGPQVARLALNANGDPSRFATPLPILPDTVPDRPGPLAGVLAALRWAAAAGAPSVLVTPADAPFLPLDLSARLEAAAGGGIAFAVTPGQPHPTVALWPVALADALQSALGAGERRLHALIAAQAGIPVAFADREEFHNINTIEGLAKADALLRARLAERHTPRLRLRPPETADLPAVIALFARPETVAHRPDPRPDSPEASAARLARDRAHFQAHGFGRWAIEQNGRVIGFGGLTRDADADAPLSISYHLDPAAWGRGYAGELVAEALHVAFRHLAAPAVEALVRPANPASRRVLERHGFLPSGTAALHGAPTQHLKIKVTEYN